MRASAATLVAAISTAAAIHPAAQQAPVFRGRTDLISIPVTVTRGRQPVTGLTAADFEVTDNGVRQRVEVARAGDVPLDLTLLLTEFSPARAGEHGRALVSADTVRERLHADDRLRLVFVDHQVRSTQPDAAYRVLTDPVAQALRWGRPISANTFDIGLVNPEVNAEAGFGIALVDGLFHALTWPVAPDRRHLVVAFTDGNDTASILEPDRLPGLIARSDAVLHAVLWTTPAESGSRSFQLANWQRSYQALDSAVRRSGGSLHRLDSVTDVLAEVVETFRSSYVLRYTPGVTPVPGWHDLRVRVTRPGSFTIRARQGYEY
jgi:VWFA-related protein